MDLLNFSWKDGRFYSAHNAFDGKKIRHYNKEKRTK